MESIQNEYIKGLVIAAIINELKKEEEQLDLAVLEAQNIIDKN